MRNPNLPPPRLNDLPLWRLLVELDDVERTVGPDSDTARLLARLIQERLRSGRQARAPVARGEAARASS